MYSLNRAQIIGHTTEDPVVRELDSGAIVADLNLEIKSKVQLENNETQFRTTFLTVTLWQKLAEIVRDYVKKGHQLYLTGRLETDSWEDDNGIKKYKTKMVADNLIMLSPKDGFLPDLDENLDITGGINVVEVIGNLTKTPELKTTPNGNNVTSFGVATNRVWKDSNGEKQEKTEFHNIVIWDSLAEVVSKNIPKGRKVYIRGRLQTRSWETPEGQKRYTTEIIATEVKSLGHGLKNSMSTESNSSSENKKESSTSSEKVAEAVNDIPEINYESDIKPEDLPF